MRSQVQDLMIDNVKAVSPLTSLDVVHSAMMEYGIRHMPVVDDQGDLVGLISQRDMLARAFVGEGAAMAQLESLASRRAKEVMSSHVETADPEMALRDAALLMMEHKYGCLPVVEGQRLVGILTEADFLRYAVQVESD